MAIDLQDIAGSTLISDLPAILNSNNTKIKNHFKATVKTINGKVPDVDGNVVVSEGGESADLSNYYTKSEIDGKGFLTEHQDISHKANIGASYTKSESDARYITEHQSLNGYATETWVNQQGYLKSVPSTYALKSDIPTDSHINDLINNALVSALQSYYTGSTTPASSLGDDGDLYLKV